jgi:hypothetical protein
MTERKPLGTSFEPWIESQIRVAMEGGAFDNLPGAGKALPDNLGDPYERWAKQLAAREEVALLLPPSLELRRKVEIELAAVEKLDDEASVRRRIDALNAEIARFNATVVDGPPTNLSPLDADHVVARWRIRSAHPQDGGR